MKDDRINKLHFLYIVGILIGIIIVLLTIDLANNQNLFNYLSFALTFTSLFLSLLAIIYAFYSNSSFFDTISILNKSSNDIARNSKSLEEITKELDEKFERFPLLMKEIEKKVDLTNAFLADQYERNNIAPNDETNEDLPQSIIDSFFKYCSTIGLYALYATYLNYKNGKSFTLKALNELTEMLPAEYTYGFLTSVSSFGVFARQDYSDNWDVTSFNKQISQKIQAIVHARAEEDKTGYLNKHLNKIEVYFGEKK